MLKPSAHHLVLRVQKCQCFRVSPPEAIVDDLCKFSQVEPKGCNASAHLVGFVCCSVVGEVFCT